MTIEKLALSVAEAVQVSGRSRTAIYLAAKAGQLVLRKNGGRTVVLVSDLKSWLENLPKLHPSQAA